MTTVVIKKRIAIIGGGPSGLFLYKRLIETGRQDFTVDIFEAKDRLGYGMPYSHEGANMEHITNVSGNEIPKLVTSIVEWIKALPAETLRKYKLNPDLFNDYKVFPRLLFGEYLNVQFDLLKQQAARVGIITNIHLNTRVSDMIDEPGRNRILIEVAGEDFLEFDTAVICTGHSWPSTHEGKAPGYFDSPYPPAKLKLQFDHTIAVRGSSLTAIDAIRTLSRHHGVFIEQEPHQVSFQPHDNAKNFKIIMHSRHGLLPGIRFHLDDPRLSKKSLLSNNDIENHIKENGGFLSLDFIFEKDFKEPFRDKDPSFYELIKDMNMEEFVEKMMGMREHFDSFLFFKGEYEEAKKSIRRKESVYWKEKLATLSFAMNYPAKHFSAEDMLKLQHVLMPLISIVIAFVPQSSCEEMIALHDAGKLEIISVGTESSIEINPEGGIVYHLTDDSGQNQQASYKTFVDCIGQRHLTVNDFPFRSLVDDGTVSAARLQFRSAETAKEMLGSNSEDVETNDNDLFYLKVPGVSIDDSFRAIEKSGAHNPRLYIMAVSHIGGFNPDYSGLDFCEEASRIIVNDIFKE